MSLDDLKQQRAITKKNISRIKTVIDANAKSEGKSLSAAELKCRLGILDSYFKQILSVQNKIENLDPDDNGRADIEDLYCYINSQIQQQLAEDGHNTTFSESSFAIPVPSNKLPRLKLPSFNGKYSEYKNFINSFKQIIDREHGLSNIEKFNHLLNCLHGHALETVKAFQVTNENYPKALERLKARYDNSTLIFMENISTLFDLPDVSKPSSGQLRSLVDNVSALYSSLQSLGSPTDIVNAMLIHIVMGKVDGDTKRKWKDSLDFSKLPTWEDCSNILERRCQYLESLDSNTSSRRPDHNSGKSNQKLSKHGYTFSCSKRVCVFCSKSDHYIAQCQRFKDLDVPIRFENVKKLGLCINCLAKGHQVTSCPSSFKCKHCSRSHHTMLHRSQSNQGPSSPEPTPSTSRAATTDTPASVHAHMESSSPHVLLATAMVLVRDNSGSYKLGRALLDSCSQLNFVTDEFAQRLNLKRVKKSVEVSSIGSSCTKVKHNCFTNIKSRITDFEVPLSFCITPHISYQPDSELDVSSWNLPPNTQLADDNFFKSKKIDLLIGTETFFDILSVGQIKLGPNLPKLQKTLFGWIVTGKYNSSRENNVGTSYLLSTEDKINMNLERLWKIEEIDAASTQSTPEQMECERFFRNTVCRESSGLSRNTALQRFAAQERRLARDSELKSQYVAFMKEYEESGHMSLVKKPILEEPHYYIPHHCVFKPNSTSTKLRVVFDASCPTSSQTSLNDILMVGPTIQDELYLLLLRFRLYRFAITADIVKMYRQVLVDQHDRKYQYILWRYSEQEPIRTYQLNTVTYGTSAAPFLAVRSLHYLADEYTENFELGARAIKTSFYVDDFLCGAESREDLAELKYQVTEILKNGCLELDKWHSNHENFRHDKTIKDLNLDDSSITNALGISWDQQKDEFLFSFSSKFKIGNIVSKRSILSLSSSLFDPLGLVAPLMIKAKIILQELWILKIGWDESVPVSEIQDLTNGCNWRHVPSSLNPADIVSRGSTTEELKSSIWFTILEEPHYYIPHHCVFKPNSTSTKLRVVFDASCPTSSQTSLNDILMVGPTIQDELNLLLLRFRLYRFAITADIVKMYRQVLVDQHDRKYQYILWRYSEQEPIRTYQLNTVTYGTSAAPFLAVRSLHYLADEYTENFELGARAIKTSFYVDDFLCGAESREDLAELKYQVTEILKNGCLELDKWHSNHENFRHDKTIKDLNLDDSSITNALGISWDQQKDEFLFSFSSKFKIGNIVSKRSILSLSSSLFDPLGLVAPLMIKAKIILQELWILKIGWDESVPAPHFGGLWEAAVKSAKGHLNRTLANTRLTFEELVTALVEIDAILNSRPISPMSSDPSDLEALTPGHFITGSALRSLPEREVTTTNINNLEHWAQITAIKQRFWKKWHHEYINELQVRNKWTASNTNIGVGSMVLVHEDNIPPQKWLMGRLTNIIPGRDGRIRVADVKTTRGIIRRPIHKLALIFN
ncbi:uncharacterized protein [Musca autumnalis]|uniref:uncharacterized protein n=1 Tax=Musca autumnalis TaxID=221902 RepID=UPI003CF35C40